MEEIDMQNNELHLGDVIVIIDRNARNYLKIGSVIETNTDKYTYVVEFVVTKFSNCGEYSSCQERIIKEYYDETLPQKCAIIYREEEENA